jgi:hypothetical protein
MVTRKGEKNFIYFGVLLIIPYLFGWITTPEVSLTVLSIFFGGLLSIYLILPTVQNVKQFQFIVKSGHIKDLILYLKIPVTISALLILYDLGKDMITFNVDKWIIVSANAIYIGLWGIFILAVARIMYILPKILINKK